MPKIATGNVFIAEDGTIYDAQEAAECDGCAFDENRSCCRAVGCSPVTRPDNRYVRWIKRAKAESEPNPL